MEHCMFHKHMNGEIIIIVIAVDDLTLTSSCGCLLDTCKDESWSEFDITKLGPMHWLLGIEVKRDHIVQTISLSQKAYINSIIACFCLKDTPPVSTPMEVGVQLVQAKNDMSTSPHVPYKKIIRSLMYMATATQPDIMFTFSVLAQFMQDPARPHWEAAKHVIRYLKGMRDLELTYGATNTGITGYTDTNHASQYHQHSISPSLSMEVQSVGAQRSSQLLHCP